MRKSNPVAILITLLFVASLYFLLPISTQAALPGCNSATIPAECTIDFPAFCGKIEGDYCCPDDSYNDETNANPALRVYCVSTLQTDGEDQTNNGDGEQTSGDSSVSTSSDRSGASSKGTSGFDADGVSINDFFSPAETFGTVGSLITVLVRNAMVIAGFIIFIVFIIAGTKIIRHAGQSEGEQLSQGKDALTAAVIGVVLIIGAFWLVQIIETVTGIAILSGVSF